MVAFWRGVELSMSGFASRTEATYELRRVNICRIVSEVLLREAEIMYIVDVSLGALAKNEHIECSQGSFCRIWCIWPVLEVCPFFAGHVPM